MQRMHDTSFILFFDLNVDLTSNVQNLIINSLICEFALTQITHVLWWQLIKNSSLRMQKLQSARFKFMKVIYEDSDLKNVLITIIAADYQQDWWCSCLIEWDTDALCIIMITIVEFYDLQVIVIKILNMIENAKFNNFYTSWRLHISWHQSRHHQFNEFILQFNWSVLQFNESYISQTYENDRLILKSHLIQSYDSNSIIKVARQKMKCFLCLLLYI